MARSPPGIEFMTVCFFYSPPPRGSISCVPSLTYPNNFEKDDKDDRDDKDEKDEKDEEDER